jgi:hypothetical protein
MSIYTRGVKVLLLKHHVSRFEISRLPHRTMSTNSSVGQPVSPKFVKSNGDMIEKDSSKVMGSPEPSNKASADGGKADSLEALTQSLKSVSISKPVGTMSIPKPERTPLPSSSNDTRTPLPSSATSSKAKSSHRTRKMKHKIPESSPTVSASANKIKGFKTEGKRKKMPSRERPKVAPSWESGGIPNPSQDYLYRANHIPQTLPVAQNLLVVIDLNGTILHRPSRNHPTSFTARPNALRFLEYCIETFSVVIWSSAQPRNVHAMVDTIIPPALRPKVVAIWARDKFRLTPEDYLARVQCYKRLTLLWEDHQIAYSHPEYAMGYRWDQTNTVLVDDSVEKGRSEPYNLIKIPEFLGAEIEARDILPQVHDHLNCLSMHSDVSACLRAYPFRAMNAPYGPADYVANGVGPLPVFQQSFQQ